MVIRTIVRRNNQCEQIQLKEENTADRLVGFRSATDYSVQLESERLLFEIQCCFLTDKID